MIAIAIDEALTLRLMADDASVALGGGKSTTEGGIGHDQRYATDADYVDDPSHEEG